MPALLLAACTLAGLGADDHRPAAPPAQDVLSAEILPGPRRVYVGQRARLTLRVEVVAPTLAGQTFDADFVLRRLDTARLGPFAPQPVRISRHVDPDGRRIHAYEFAAEIVPHRPAPLEIDNITLGLRYPSEAGTRELVARPAPVTLAILPVPEANRPPRYTGAVGIIDIEVAATPTRIRVGDPIEFTIDLFGDADLATLPPPALDGHTRLAADFRLPDAPLTGRIVDGRRRFVTRIRARTTDVWNVPPIEYPYFDPYAERFHVARSAPIPLDVRPAATATPGPASSGERDAGAQPGPTFISRLEPGTLTPDDLLHDAFVLRARHVRLALAAPPIAFAGIAFAAWLARRRRIQPAVIAGAALCAVLPTLWAASPPTDRRALAGAALDALAAADRAAASFDASARTAHLRAAAAQLEALAATGLKNATLEHLLGAACLDLDAPGPAVLHLRRAAALAPFRSRIRHDLNAARLRVAAAAPAPRPLAARLEAPATSHMQEAFIRLGFCALLPASLLGSALLALPALAAARVRRQRRAVLIGGGLLVAAAAGLGAAVLWTLHDRAQHPPAVVIADAGLHARRARTSETDPATPLPPGVELRLLEDRAGWVRVRLSGGATGWVPASAVARI